MKMLLLTSMFIMLFYRIKNTYQSISKKKMGIRTKKQY